MKRASPIALWLFLTLMAGNVFADDPASSSPKWELVYHSVVPLGQDVLLLQPDNHVLSFRAVAESIGFEGWHRSYGDTSDLMLAADGSRVERYPRFVDFLVTISAQPETGSTPLPGLEPLLLNCESQCTDDLDEYLLNLKFRIMIFRALHVAVLEPKAVKEEWMPAADFPSDARTYRISFDLGEVPLTDRIVLEVLSPAGERLTKFHLDM